VLSNDTVRTRTKEAEADQRLCVPELFPQTQHRSGLPPMLSVIVPTRNSERELRLTLPALMESARHLSTVSGDVFEVILTDDGSVRPLPSEFLDRFPCVKYLEHAKLGRGPNRNHGASRSRGEKLVFIDSDVEVERHSLYDLTAPLRSGTASVCSGHIRLRTSAAPKPLEKYIDNRWRKLMARFARTLSPWESYSTMFAMNRALFEDSGGFSSRFRHYGGEDTEFFLRLKRDHGAVFAFADEAVGWHHQPIDMAANLRREYWSNHSRVLVMREHPLPAEPAAPDPIQRSWKDSIIAALTRHRQWSGLRWLNPVISRLQPDSKLAFYYYHFLFREYAERGYRDGTRVYGMSTREPTRGIPLSPVDARRPRISICIPSRNRPESLARAVASISNSDFTDWEIVVIDNSDGEHLVKNASVCRSDSRIRRTRARPRIGIGALRQLGVRAARGDIIVCLDDDAEVPTNWLSEIARAFAEDPLLGIHGCRVVDIDEKGSPIRGSTHGGGKKPGTNGAFKPATSPEEIETFGEFNLAMPRRVVLDVGGFDPRFKWGHEGADLTHRILRLGFHLKYNSEVALAHHHDLYKPRPRLDKSEYYRLLFFFKYHKPREFSLRYELERLLMFIRRRQLSSAWMLLGLLPALPCIVIESRSGRT
jgi:glycosyltransferase involved in cell wall biosynthesis